jgi:hypothetical protein
MMFSFLKEDWTGHPSALKKPPNDEQKCHSGIRDSCCKLACDIGRWWPDIKIWDEINRGGYIRSPEDAEEELRTSLHTFYKLGRYMSVKRKKRENDAYISKTKSIMAWQGKAMQKCLNIRMVQLCRTNYCSIEHFTCERLVCMLISDNKWGYLYKK